MTTYLKALNTTFDDDAYVWPPSGFDAFFEFLRDGVAADFTSADGLFTDAAATTPVAAAGDAISYATDDSGFGHPFIRSTSPRPLWNLDSVNNKSGMFSETSGRRTNTQAATTFANAKGITLVMAGRFLSSPGAGPLLRLQNTSSRESYLDVTSSGVKIRRITGETEVASDAVFTLAQPFVLSVAINYESGTAAVRLNGSHVQSLTLTSSGVCDLASSAVALFGDLDNTAFCLGFIYGLAIAPGYVDGETLLDYEDKLALDANITLA